MFRREENLNIQGTEPEAATSGLSQLHPNQVPPGTLCKAKCWERGWWWGSSSPTAKSLMGSRESLEKATLLPERRAAQLTPSQWDKDHGGARGPQEERELLSRRGDEAMLQACLLEPVR